MEGLYYAKRHVYAPNHHGLSTSTCAAVDDGKVLSQQISVVLYRYAIGH